MFLSLPAEKIDLIAEALLTQIRRNLKKDLSIKAQVEILEDINRPYKPK